MMSENISIQSFAGAAALSAGVAAWLLQLATASSGDFAICLSGGATPRRLYAQLATAPYRSAFPWPRTQLFWGDERFVPHDDAASNFRMVDEALLRSVAIPAENVHPVPTVGLSPEAAAQAYESVLKNFYGGQILLPTRPLFDVTLLGLGPDGHIASLFPGTAALDQRQGWVAAVAGATPVPRITLTYPALESSRHVAFLVQGAEKQAVLQRFLAGDQSLPAARLKTAGQLHVFTDAAAYTAIHGAA